MLLKPGFILAIALALVHGFATKLPIFKIIPRFRWASFAGGISLSYVFLEIFPELGHAQEELQHSNVLLVQYLEKHVYILAMVGLLAFYSLDYFAQRSKTAAKSMQKREHQKNTIFWINLGASAVFNAILGYLLQDLSDHSLKTCILFFITSALHFFIIDDNLREHQSSLFDRRGRWLLVAAIIFGAIIGQVAHLEEAMIIFIWSFLAGSIILNVLRRELPDEKDNCFWSFSSGIVLFTTMLVAI